MLMAVINVMILIMNKKRLFILTLICFHLNSCDAIKDYTGFSKPNIDDSSYISEVPDLVLPPDFGREATVGTTKNNVIKNQTFDIPANSNFGTVAPNIPNFEAKRFTPSSPTPSDSLEKFKNNRKFTIGQWVYQQYVEGFKQGNIYYRPVYDRGYNFSRRYLPGQSSSSNFGLQPEYNNYSSENFQVYQQTPSFLSSDELPIIE